jgi:hypothetical protein
MVGRYKVVCGSHVGPSTLLGFSDIATAEVRPTPLLSNFFRLMPSFQKLQCRVRSTPRQAMCGPHSRFSASQMKWPG